MSSNLILTSIQNGIRLIKFNNPKRKNAWLPETYSQFANILKTDATNDDVITTIFTGEGDYYSSGNDFSPQMSDTDSYEDIINNKVSMAKNFVKALIDYPKLLIAVVNGPAIGIAVTSLSLFDVVYASDRATFQTPFVNLGICPEGCSSYLFPRIMGRSKASKMLLLGKKMTAQEAFMAGFVAEVVPHNKLDQLFKELERYGELPVNSVRISKGLINANIKETLHKVNEHECTSLINCLNSEEFMEAMINFANRAKSKL